MVDCFLVVPLFRVVFFYSKSFDIYKFIYVYFLLFRKFALTISFIFMVFIYALGCWNRVFFMHVLTVVNTVLKFDTSLKNVIKATVGKKLYLFFFVDNRYFHVVYILNTLNIK